MKDDIDVKEIIKENERRLKQISAPYDPITGEGCLHDRILLELSDHLIKKQYIPKKMVEENEVIKDLLMYSSIEEYLNSLNIEQTKEHIDEVIFEIFLIRIQYDFEHYANLCIKIEDKITGSLIPFKLNRGQQKLLKELERQRIAGIPIRIILLKARQLGGSTLLQIYFLWIQVILKKNFSSIICAHTKDASKNIRAMFDRAIKEHPIINRNGTKLELTPFEGTKDIKVLKERGCRIAVGTAQEPDSIRSQNGFLVHFSEVAFFPSTENNNPKALIGAVSSLVPRIPLSIIVYESTAKGVGGFFHSEWTKASRGVSAFIPVFVPWFLIDIYSDDKLRINRDKLAKNEIDFINSMNEYEWYLWDKGATLQAINWYRGKKSEAASEESMKEEFPTDPIEAFQSASKNVFDINKLEALRKSCREPDEVGDIEGNIDIARVRLEPNPEVFENLKFKKTSKGKGLLKIWERPDKTQNVLRRYLVVVDTGGRSEKSDWSVIAVFDRYWMMYGGSMHLVAEWRGHIDHDMLVWKAAQIAKWYNDALLVFESNTHDTEYNKYDSDGEHSEFIFDTIARYYPNLYCRTPSDKIKEGVPPKWGFHMNRSTKSMIIDNFIAILREGGYIERNDFAINEGRNFEKKENGSFGAIDGENDDIIITRLIGCYIGYAMDMPKLIEEQERVKTERKVLGEATI